VWGASAFLGVVFLLLLLAGAARADSIDIVMDSSGSMQAPAGNGQTKIEAAKDAIRALVDRLPAGTSVGLRVYGATVPNTDRARGCKDTQSVIPVGPLDPGKAKTAIAGYAAKGFTPIALGLRKAAADLPSRGQRTIVLVSDGINTCSPPPCPVARELHKKGIDLSIETVGFQVDAAARAQLKCIAREGGGSYSDATSAGDLAQQLAAVSLRGLRTYRPRGKPVTGGASPGAAPSLAVGQYVDQLSTPDASRWYAVDVQRGQELLVGGALVPPRRATGERLSGKLNVRVVDAAGRDVIPEGVNGVAPLGFQVVGHQAIGFGVRSRLAGAAQPTGGNAPAGTYHVQVALSGADFGVPSMPLELTVQLLGKPSPVPARKVLPAQRKVVHGSRPAGPPIAAAAVFGLLGLAGGVSLRRRRKS
jgi:Ca-activated chloride channel homolog